MSERDYTVEIQAAIDEADATGGGTVQLGRGRHSFSVTHLTVPESVRLRGAPSDTLTFIVSGEERTVSRDLWDRLLGPKPDESFICNGCTKSPDYWLDIPVWVACVIHDFGYSPDSTLDRLQADWRFRKNLWRIARYYGAPWYRAAYVASLYHTAVLSLGWTAYDGDS